MDDAATKGNNMSNINTIEHTHHENTNLVDAHQRAASLFGFAPVSFHLMLAEGFTADQITNMELDSRILVEDTNPTGIFCDNVCRVTFP